MFLVDVLRGSPCRNEYLEEEDEGDDHDLGGVSRAEHQEQEQNERDLRNGIGDVDHRGNELVQDALVTDEETQWKRDDKRDEHGQEQASCTGEEVALQFGCVFDHLRKGFIGARQEPCLIDCVHR